MSPSPLSPRLEFHPFVGVLSRSVDIQKAMSRLEGNAGCFFLLLYVHVQRATRRDLVKRCYDEFIDIDYMNKIILDRATDERFRYQLRKVGNKFVVVKFDTKLSEADFVETLKEFNDETEAREVFDRILTKKEV